MLSKIKKCEEHSFTTRSVGNVYRPPKSFWHTANYESMEILKSTPPTKALENRCGFSAK